MCGMTQEVVMKQQRAEKQKLSGTAETLRKKQQNSSVTIMSSNNSSSSGCSFREVDEPMKHVELAIYIPIFIVGMFFNLGALLVYCRCLRKWTESTIYMTSLALMDLLLLLPLPFKMHAAYHTWPQEFQFACSFLENLYFVGTYGGIYMIMCIGVDRWLAICHPFKAKQLRSPKAAVMTCMGIWVLVFTAIFPVTFNLRTVVKNDFHCFHRFSENGWSPKVIVCLQIFGFLAPALTLVCCSAQVIWTLQESGQRSTTSQACVKIICSGLCCFLVPFTPSHLAIFLQFLVHQKVIVDCGSMKSISMFLQTTMCLSNITCCLDGLCYYFIADEVKKNTKNNFRMSRLSQRRGNSSTSELGSKTNRASSS
ncbi:PREDICTED: G-protein coupled receptor 55-like [Poecilia mexicana]|nr:PREDICTED: G-protein coupled receptor 55-like [Poecilia mexicana]XP_014830292.1 PREDICTED: G-protein coupled receptor 55-like [Poecilia mexicana]